MAELFETGCKRAKLSAKDYKYIPTAAQKEEEIPTEYELPLKGLSILNQGAICSCTGHGIASTAQWHNIQQTGNTAKMSPGFIYGYRKNYEYKGTGMDIRAGLDNLLKVGIPFNDDFPYNEEVPNIFELTENKCNDSEFMKKAYKNRCSAYYAITTGNDDVKRAIMNHGPVVINMAWYQGFSNATSVMKAETTISHSNHCVIIYGWDDIGWKIQNSHGMSWGVFGRSVLPYQYKIYEFWGVTDNITDDIQIPEMDVKFFIKYCIYSFANLVNSIPEGIKTLGGKIISLIKKKVE